jgi:4-amino-4-deoxy-L-arabinose transferase-like glycosyltransferase
MQIKKKDFNNIFAIFLLSHLVIWTFVPSFSNDNLPLDTIEALAWGSNLDWGFNKHPPLSALIVEIFYQIFGSQDWAYYFLSQMFVVISFFVVWKFSEDFFKNKIHSLIAILLLEGIYFYNYTTPEFNVYICELPFWALTVLFCWKGFNSNKTSDWLLFGLFAALGALSHYLFLYLLAAIDVFFLYMIIKKKIDFKCLISMIPFFLILLPHLIWLTENNYTTITYGLHRTGAGDQNFLDHLLHPLIFVGKQTGILLPFFLMVIFLIPKRKLNLKINFKNKKLLFLLTINIIPIILIFLTSMFMGVKIRTMWMTPFYLFFGILFIYILKSKINLNKLKNFIITFLILFSFSPFVYTFISIAKKDKRTDYPGKEIATKVQNSWNKKYKSEISFVSGNEWVAGNLSYHLKSRPKWIGTKIDENLKDKLSMVDVYIDEINEAILKIGYFNVYGKK